MSDSQHPEASELGAALLVAEADDAVPDEGSKRRLGIPFWLAIGWLVVIVLAAILAPWLPIADPEANNVNVTDWGLPPYSPDGEFWFGSDANGRDVFARTVFGARISLTVGFVAIACGMLIGGTAGIIAGYTRGVLDKIISFIFLVLLSFPSLVLAILITTLVNRDLVTVSGILGFLSIAPIGRLARAATIQFADREFVVAARTLGASHRRIIMRELLPNVVIPMSALALLGMAIAIVAEGSLAFLGLSVPGEISWGRLISEGSGSAELTNSPWMALFPILIMFLTVASLNFAGDRLRDYFDVKELSL